MKNKINRRTQMEKLYELYESKIYAEAYSMIEDVQQAEDVVQKTFIKLSEKSAKLRNLESDFVKMQVLREVKAAVTAKYKQIQKEKWLFEFADEEIPYEQDNLDEDIAIERFISGKSAHVFSDSYEQKKEEFLKRLEIKEKKHFIIERLFHQNRGKSKCIFKNRMSADSR